MPPRPTQAYSELAQAINQAQQSHYSFAIITLPGFGISYYLKNYCQQNKNISYITDQSATLTDFNFLDFDLDSHPDRVSWLDNYFQKATPDQKFAVVINAPYLLSEEKINNSFFIRHIYEKYYFQVAVDSDIEIICHELNPKISAEKIKNIKKLSGGIRRLIKSLVVAKTDDSDQEIEKLALPTARVAQRCSEEILINLGIKDDHGDWRPQILQDIFDKKILPEVINLQILPDLTLKENGQLSPQSLTKVEKEILENILGNNGTISREKIAEIKWGVGSYDQFSDQAITKTIKRLSRKLVFYRLKSISKLGYKLVNRRGSKSPKPGTHR